MLKHHTLAAELLASLPIFPLPNLVLLPGMILPLNVFEPRYLDLVDHALECGQHIGVPLLRPGYEADYEGRPEIEPVFGVGKLLSHLRLPDGRRFIRLEGLARARLLSERDLSHSFRVVAAEPLPEEPPREHEHLEVLKAQVERLAWACNRNDTETVDTVLSINDPRVFTYTVTALLPSVEMLISTAINRRLFRGSSYTEFQQRCLASATTDERVTLLLERVGALLDVLQTHARLPAEMCN